MFGNLSVAHLSKIILNLQLIRMTTQKSGLSVTDTSELYRVQSAKIISASFFMFHLSPIYRADGVDGLQEMERN